jgi:hypothetical protein
MTTMVQHPSPSSRHPRWEAIKRSFTQSNYITDFWNWLMTLMSKAAELVLFGSVLYSGYQLLPNITHAPAQVDAIIFVIQQAALDIGGMGLLKLAKRAGLPKDSFPMRVGVILVVLMILNVVLASLKQTLPLIPPGVFIGIETSLLIARAIMAVLFGYAIHAVREEYGESTITIKDAGALQQHLVELSSELSRVQENVQQRLSSELATVRDSLHQYEAHLEACMRQPILPSSASTEAPEAQRTRRSEAPKAPREAKRPASPSSTQASTNVLTLQQRHPVPTEKRAAVYALLETDQRLSSYEIAAQTGYPPSTIQRYMKDWKARQAEAGSEPAHEASDTAM